jgi:hypothetical protein
MRSGYKPDRGTDRTETTIMDDALLKTAIAANGSSTATPVQCQPWCLAGDGHPNEWDRLDQSCWGAEHAVQLSTEPKIHLVVGGAKQQYLSAYLEKAAEDSAPSRVFIGHNGKGKTATLDEAKAFALEILVLVDTGGSGGSPSATTRTVPLPACGPDQPTDNPSDQVPHCRSVTGGKWNAAQEVKDRGFEPIPAQLDTQAAFKTSGRPGSALLGKALIGEADAGPCHPDWASPVTSEAPRPVVILYEHELLGEGIAKYLQAQLGVEATVASALEPHKVISALTLGPGVVIFELTKSLRQVDITALAPGAVLIDVSTVVTAGPAPTPDTAGLHRILQAVRDSSGSTEPAQ